MSEPREPEQLDLVAAIDEDAGLDPWMREVPIRWLLDTMSARVGERVRLVLLDEEGDAA